MKGLQKVWKTKMKKKTGTKMLLSVIRVFKKFMEMFGGEGSLIDCKMCL